MFSHDQKNRKFLKAFSWGIIAILFNVFTTLYVTPQVVLSVGIDAYGFVSLSSNIISYIQIVMIAFNAYASRYISISYLRKDNQEFQKYFNTVFWGNLLIGAIILILFSAFSLNINTFLVVPDGILDDVKLLFVCVGINYFIGLISVAWKVFAQIKDRVDLLNVFESISYLVQIVILFISLSYLTPRVWYVGYSHLVAAALVLFLSFLQTKRYLPELEIKAKSFSKGAFHELIIKGLWNSIDSLGNTLNSGLDLLITDLMLTPVEMGKVSLAKSIMALITRLYTMVAQIFHPRFIKNYAEKNTEELVSNLKKAIRTSSIITNTVFACFIFLGVGFIDLWIQNQDTNLIYNLSMLCLLPCVIEGMTFPLYFVYTLTTKLKVPTIVTLASGLLNVVSMYILLNNTSLGVYAVVVTTAVIVTLAHLITPFYSCKCLSINIFTFIPTLCSCILELIICIAVLFLINKILSPVEGWGVFLLNGIIMGGSSLLIGIAFLCLSKCKLNVKM